MMMINNIPMNAPLFKGAKQADLEAVIKHLQDASYHYADDSGREWGAARKHVLEAAEILNKTGIGYRAICSVHLEAKPIMPVDDIIDAVLRSARTDPQEPTP